MMWRTLSHILLMIWYKVLQMMHLLPNFQRKWSMWNMINSPCILRCLWTQTDVEEVGEPQDLLVFSWLTAADFGFADDVHVRASAAQLVLLLKLFERSTAKFESFSCVRLWLRFNFEFFPKNFLSEHLLTNLSEGDSNLELSMPRFWSKAFLASESLTFRVARTMEGCKGKRGSW